MQTFLPYPNFWDSAACLDRQRLGKQRSEAYQLLNALYDSSNGWRNHPATRMWRGHEDALRAYMKVMCLAWQERGYTNTMTIPDIDETAIVPPPWLGDDRLHSSHRAALLYKSPEHYSQFGWTETPQIKYYWPV